MHHQIDKNQKKNLSILSKTWFIPDSIVPSLDYIGHNQIRSYVIQYQAINITQIATADKLRVVTIGGTTPLLGKSGTLKIEILPFVRPFDRRATGG